ncbi:MAG: hypothetical protein RLZ55_940 [Actinomycetota bacterium]
MPHGPAPTPRLSVDGWIAGLSGWALCLVVWGVVFAETGLLLGFLLPGDSLLFAAGLLSAAPGGVNPGLLAAGVFLAAVAGDQVGYSLGTTYGRPYVDRRGERVRTAVDRAEAFYARYGAISLVVARFIPWARTFVPFAAGLARMPRLRFGVANAVGALCWGVGLVALGYFAYQVPWLRDVALLVALVAVAGSLLVWLVVWIRSRRAAHR